MEYIAGSIGLTNNQIVIDFGEFLFENLKHVKGTMGYQQPSVGLQNKNQIPSFILICEDSGIILIDIVVNKIEIADDTFEWWKDTEGNSLKSRDLIIDNFSREIETRLKQDLSIYDRKNHKLKLNILKILFFVKNTKEEVEKLDLLNVSSHSNEESLTSINKFIEENKIEVGLSDKIYSLLEGTSVFEKSKENPVPSELKTMNDYILKSLNFTFKLDREQRKVSMQIPSGPQRIRGLAGTGKTVILALKAALTHKDFEDYKILYVFNTQSMYNQVKYLISAYYAFEARKAVNWDCLEVQHAFGGKYKGGLYYNTCVSLDLTPFNFSQVKGHKDPYEFIFSDLLSKAKNKIKPIYDMVLIDEAQDFPPSFFELIYHLTKPPHRIIWAYDEFQSLSDLKIKEPEDLFGRDKNGKPNIPNDSLGGSYIGGIEKDYILSNSYRNPRINLMVAHGLGLGIYRKAGIIDILPDKKSWNALGYEVIEPIDKDIYNEGDNIIIKRPENSSKNLLEKILKETGKEDIDKRLVKFQTFNSSDSEYSFVIKEIQRLIYEQNLAPEQIIVISLANSNTKNIFNHLRQQLDFLGIKCITPGFVEDSDKFQEKGYVTLTTPYRAKGNEANIAFVTDIQEVAYDLSFKGRNAIFVSITRARGWCYITGSGRYSITLKEEFDTLISNYPEFKFIFPKDEDIKRRRVILNKDENEVEKLNNQMEFIFNDNSELLIEKLKDRPDLLDQIKKIIQKDG